MTDSIKMMKLDFLTAKKYIKQIFLSGIFVSVIMMTSLPHAVNVVYFIFASYFLMYPFMIADQNGLEKYYSIVPCEKYAIVNGKYLAALLNLFMTLLILTPVNMLMKTVMKTVMKENYQLEVNLACIVVGIVMYSVMVSIQLPCCLKFGYAKAKVLNMVLPLGIGFGVPAIVFVAEKFLSKEDFASIMDQANRMITGNYGNIVLGGILVSFGCLLISYFIALRVYKSKK